MAKIELRLKANVDGDFYVDESCIDCGTCRWMAPDVFDQQDDRARVHRQPGAPARVLASLQALIACPTASIGTIQEHDIAAVAADFPLEITDGVYHCGYHHPHSFGAASYFIVRPEGNILVDSPRFSGPLIERIDALGGIHQMFLTHKDDVAAHAKFAARFGCERILHAADVTSQTRDVEIQPAGEAAHRLADDLLVIPAPGHTRGSSCLLYDQRFLFTGDHLAWSLRLGRLYAFHTACWFDWDTQIDSMRKLATYDFEHVLPGHGAPCHFSKEAMREHMRSCVEWMGDGV